jgi:ATP-dependent DNA helicase DinG
MFNFENEISPIPPQWATPNPKLGIPIFKAFDCILFEKELGRQYAYIAVNMETGETELIWKQKKPLMVGRESIMAERIQQSRIAGHGRFEVERTYGKPISYEKCREILYEIFSEVLPQFGYCIRSEQIALADSILESICSRGILLSEAEVGTGKTLAYLIAAILAKRGRLNEFWIRSLYPKMSYIDLARMPIVVATSSIALQNAIVTDYIPELSGILLEYGVISTPITTVLRKGKENYVCKRKLLNHLFDEGNKKHSKILKQLLWRGATIDLAKTDGLDAYTKRKIAVPKRCDGECSLRADCPYLRFRSRTNDSMIDIQVVNHNYFLADIKLRRNGQIQQPLIPNYQVVIIDEAHKFLSAARTMYGTELSSFTIPEIKENISNLHFIRSEAQLYAYRFSKKLIDESVKLFHLLNESSLTEDIDDEQTRFRVVVGIDAERHISNLRNISDLLYELINSEKIISNGDGLRSQIIWDLGNVRDALVPLAMHEDHICWLEHPDEYTHKGKKQEIKICAIPKDLDQRLFADIWSKPIPIILTSGTLSDNGDFSHIKRTLGLDMDVRRLFEIRTGSPFNHKENALLYISENVPFPDNFSDDYILAVTDEVERLIRAAFGHTAVLFTSYKVMSKVWEHLLKRSLPYPLFTLNKSDINDIERFKQSDGGVLLAAGALWEGIDIPGDALSMLIIVKLPFAVPDPVSEYEKTLYPSMKAYKKSVIVPEMLIKLKQGFGRLIRTETDTGVVAILDSRANSGGAYHRAVLNALPDCTVTCDIVDVVAFMEEKKSAEYFL